MTYYSKTAVIFKSSEGIAVKFDIFNSEQLEKKASENNKHIFVPLYAFGTPLIVFLLIKRASSRTMLLSVADRSPPKIHLAKDPFH
jgi:hypothetical protein